MADMTTQARPIAAQAAEGAPVLSVIVPSFNERPNVEPMIAKLDAALQGIAWEVIYVDDNSPDGMVKNTLQRYSGQLMQVKAGQTFTFSCKPG